MRRTTTGELRTLQAITILTRGARDLPPWATELVASIKAAAEARPEPPEPAREAPVANPMQADDFETALRATWSEATAAERQALRTVATALGIEVPADPEPAPDPEPDPPAKPAAPHSEPCAPEETAPEDTRAEEPEGPPRLPRGSKPAGFSMVDDGDDEPTDLLGDWSFYVPNRRRD